MFYLMGDAIKKIGVYPQVTDISPGFKWQAFDKANREFDPVREGVEKEKITGLGFYPIESAG